MCVIKAMLPVLESFGFNSYIREQTSGQAFPSMSFHSWQNFPSSAGDPLDASSKIGQLITQTRRRKGIKETIPDLGDYLDKL